MKKYQNIGKMVGTVQFEDHTQFLSRGQYIESDKTVIRVSKGIEIIDLEPVVQETQAEDIQEKSVIKKKTRKKRVTKKPQNKQQHNN